jgi:four helix bundle protein
VIGRQYLRSATSIGANVEEAQAAESRPDFIHKMGIAQKEARESLYWLRLLRASGIVPEISYLRADRRVEGDSRNHLENHYQQ